MVFIFAVWIKRALWMRAFHRSHEPLPETRALSQGPQVTVIVPARNEEKNIARCLFHLFKQNYKNYEILVVDDRSTDRTPHLLENFKKLSPVPFKTVRIEKLPPGWTGKNHAMFVASRAATGEWLLFTDADTTHGAQSVQSALATAIERRIDFLTLAPETECHSFWEHTVQPLAVSSLALWFDPVRINTDKEGTALANGQFLLIRRDVYEKLGGNEAVKTEVVEDVALARKARREGYTVRFLNGTRLYSTRMYSSLREIKTGWTRIFTYLFDKKIAPIAHKIFLFLFFSCLPFFSLGAQAILKFAAPEKFSPFLFVLSLAVSAWIVLVRAIGNKMVKARPAYALLHPLGSLVMVWILLACIGRIAFNRPSVWKGQAYN